MCIRDRLPGSYQKIVIDFHNIAARQYRSMTRLGLESSSLMKSIGLSFLMRTWERGYANRADCCLAVSDSDASWLRKHAPLTLSLIHISIGPMELETRPRPAECPFAIIFDRINRIAGHRVLAIYDEIQEPPPECEIAESSPHPLDRIKQLPIATRP